MSALRTCRRAFALAELLATVTVVAAVLAVYIVLSSRSRAMAALGESVTNLRQLTTGYLQYGQDNQSRIATFSWRAGEFHAGYPLASSDLQAAAYQAVSIMRTRANMPQIPIVTGWNPYIYYGHLSLLDYFGYELPTRLAISPEDKQRLSWALDRSRWGTQGSTNYRWAFSSSYEGPYELFSATGMIDQSGYEYNQLSIHGNDWGRRRLDEITFPSFKALLYDRHQRHFGPRQAFFMHQEARIPVASADGNVAIRRSEHGNPGWQPRNPSSDQASMISYRPSSSGAFAWDPPALDPSGTDIVPGRYRYTRGASPVAILMHPKRPEPV